MESAASAWRFAAAKKDERRKSLGTFSCNANRRYGGKVCTTHYISLEQVKAIVLADIRRHAMLAAEDADAYADYLIGLVTGWAVERAESHGKKNWTQPQRRLSELATLVQRIYEDNVSDGSRMTSTKPYLPSMKRKQKNWLTRFMTVQLTNCLQPC